MRTNSDHLEPLVPVGSLLKGRTPRAVARLCRTGKIPGARKVGLVWMIAPSAWRAYVAGEPTNKATSTAEADLLRAGYRFTR